MCDCNSCGVDLETRAGLPPRKNEWVNPAKKLAENNYVSSQGVQTTYQL